MDTWIDHWLLRALTFTAVLAVVTLIVLLADYVLGIV